MSGLNQSDLIAPEFSKVETALVVNGPDDVAWQETADFVIVGYGGAGVTAANQAADAGLSVIALDRFEGGGATTLSGGVLYLGGGTSVQKEAGYDDTPEGMLEYLSREVENVVSEETLRRFCESGPETIEWLKAHGLSFSPSVYAKKTSYPASRYYLYFPDNSLLESRRGKHPPAPRGHKVHLDLGKNAAMGFGRAIIGPLQKSASAAGVRVFCQSDARQLIVDRNGMVLGVKISHVSPDHPEHHALVQAQRSMQKWYLMLPQVMPGARLTIGIGSWYGRRAEAIERRAGRPLYVRARKGLCLAGGGFIFNPKMLQAYAPAHAKVMPVGTLADDGSAILLGRSAGGATGRMDNVSSWRFLNPPSAWARGMLVNTQGQRFVNEASYGATIGQEMMKPANGAVGWLILDRELWQLTKHNLKNDDLLPVQIQPAFLTMLFSSKKAPTLRALAAKIGVNADGLEASAMAYRSAKASGASDAFGKSPGDMGALTTPPYYALNLGIESPFFPLPSITLGGLMVDERSGLVLRQDGTTIPGLYAAGRTAIGLCSNLYLSGLSIADCVFSGRRAAAHAASLNDGPQDPRRGFSAVLQTGT